MGFLKYSVLIMGTIPIYGQSKIYLIVRGFVTV